MKCFKLEYKVTKAALTAWVYVETEEEAREVSNHHAAIINANKETQINVLDMKLLNLVEVK